MKLIFAGFLGLVIFSSVSFGQQTYEIKKMDTQKFRKELDEKLAEQQKVGTNIKRTRESSDEDVQKALDQINAARKTKGLPALKLSDLGLTKDAAVNSKSEGKRDDESFEGIMAQLQKSKEEKGPLRPYIECARAMDMGVYDDNIMSIPSKREGKEGFYLLTPQGTHFYAIDDKEFKKCFHNSNGAIPGDNYKFTIDHDGRRTNTIRYYPANSRGGVDISRSVGKDGNQASCSLKNKEVMDKESKAAVSAAFVEGIAKRKATLADNEFPFPRHKKNHFTKLEQGSLNESNENNESNGRFKRALEICENVSGDGNLQKAVKDAKESLPESKDQNRAQPKPGNHIQ